MHASTLQTLLNHVNSDDDFRGRLEADAGAALLELELSAAEYSALTSTDEDALRRMESIGAGYGSPVNGVRSWLTRHLCTRWFCGGTTRSWACPTHAECPSPGH